MGPALWNKTSLSCAPATTLAAVDCAEDVASRLRRDWLERGAAPYVLPVNACLSEDVRALFAAVPEPALCEDAVHDVGAFVGRLVLAPDVLSSRDATMALAAHLRLCARRLAACFVGDAPVASSFWAAVRAHYREGRVALAVLMACSETEDALHALVFCIGGTGVHNRKLSESLDHPCVAMALGTHLTAVLRALVGPFMGFNLRNVLWHGFVAELDPHIGGMALCVLEAVHGVLLDSGAAMPPKLDVTPFEADWDPVVMRVFGGMTGTERAHAARRVVENSYFAIGGTQAAWIDAFELIFVACDYVCGLTVLLPLLEHAIRRVYVAANGSSGATLFTASNDELYTTLDVLLGVRFSARMPRVNGPCVGADVQHTAGGDSVNAVYEALSGGRNDDAVVNALLDCVLWDSACRLRDAIAHGRVDWGARVPQQALLMAAIALALLRRFARAGGAASVDALDFDVRLGAAYVPRHHPRARLLRAVDSCCEPWAQFAAQCAACAQDGPFHASVAAFVRHCAGGALPAHWTVFPLAEPFASVRLLDDRAARSMPLCPPRTLASLWSVLANACSTLRKLLVALGGSFAHLAEQARARRQKRPVLAHYRDHVAGVAALLSALMRWMLTVCDAPQHHESAVELSDFFGLLLGCTERGEYTRLLHYVAAFVCDAHGWTDQASMLNAREALALARFASFEAPAFMARLTLQ